MKNIVLGITGSISAYKAADIASRLRKEKYNIDVIMTDAATKFITPLTMQTVSKNKVYTDMFENYVPSEVEHISLAKKADLFLVAPATANFIAKAAVGLADDMLTSVFLALKKETPVVICPAMNTAMYENQITQKNILTLKDSGFEFVEPRESLLACGDLGKGALAEVDIIINKVNQVLSEESGGGTLETQI
jgi:phosphopantothenoylcysteine decarboxylase